MIFNSCNAKTYDNYQNEDIEIKMRYNVLKPEIKKDTETQSQDISDKIFETTDIDNFNFFGNKKEVLRMKIESIKMMISERVKINNKKLDGIDNDILGCGNEICKLDHIPVNYNDSADKKRSNALKDRLKLETESRQEMSDCWKDLLFLRNDFINAIIEYQEMNKKERMFN